MSNAGMFIDKVFFNGSRFFLCSSGEEETGIKRSPLSIWSEPNREWLEAYVLMISIQRLFPVINGNIAEVPTSPRA